ncbi:5624_t:CDS:2, partial [Paraglomus occultum]
SERASKRPRIDTTATICQKLISKFETIPTRADQLEPLINSQLLCKLPASRNEEEKDSELVGLIYTNEDDRYGDLAYHISVALSKQFNDNVSDIESEDDVHHIIDCLIKDTLRLFNRNAVPGSLDLMIRRNTVDRGWTTTTVGTCRPDFLVHHKNVLVLKGEEKATQNMFQEALGDLTNKFDKLDPLFFGDQQFLICYAVAGWKIGFYAIDGTPEAASKPSRLVTLSPQFDLRKVTDRITVISVVINILRILVTIGPSLPNDVIPLYLPIQQDSGSIITFNDDSVVKELSFKYLPYVDGSLNERIAFLTEMYDHAKGC